MIKLEEFMCKICTTCGICKEITHPVSALPSVRLVFYSLVIIHSTLFFHNIFDPVLLSLFCLLIVTQKKWPLRQR